MDLRLVAYQPGGARLGVMPEPLSVTVSVPFNDVGSLSVTYSALTAGGDILARGLEVGLEIGVEVAHGNRPWVEPWGARFLLIERRQDPLDEAGTVTLTLPAVSWLLRKARNLETANLLPDDHGQKGKRPFYSATAGAMLATLLQENTARGGISLPRGFSATRDSADEPWEQIATLYFDLGLDLWTIVRSLADQGMVDWTTVGRSLEAYNTGGVLARDQSDGSGAAQLRLGSWVLGRDQFGHAGRVRLHLGRDITAAPEDESLVDVVGRVLIRGDEGLLLTETNPSAPAPWGVWEGFIQQGGVSDEGTARSLVQADLARGGRVRGQYTRTILPATAAHFPFLDYQPGDYVRAPGSRGAEERLRVQQVTLTRDSDGLAGNLVLNDRIVEAELRRTRRITGIVGGSSADGGSGVRPTPEGPDLRQPAAPADLVVSSNAYIDETGEPRGQVSSMFAEVNADVAGVALEVEDYQLWGRQNVTGAPWRHLTTTDTLQADYSPLPVGQEWLFRVRARGRYNAIWGAWSAVVGALVARDTTPPPKPSPPVLSSGLGAIRVQWDGETSIGTGQPLDFDHAEIIMSATTSSGDGEVVGTFRREGLWPVTGQTVGELRHFWLRSVDTSGNASPLSDRRQVTVVSVRDSDLIDTSLDTFVDDIAAADSKADDAVIAAGEAQAAADQAGIDASSAEQAASDAVQAALDAAGIAEGKGVVLFQAATPAAEYRAATTLWIDTTGGRNTPKRWTGSAWEAVTDKAATDAADAAQAAQDKADQAESDASDALDTANDAHSLAGTAEDNAQAAINSASAAATAAQNAQDSADGVAQNLFSTNNPSGTAPYGSMWFKVNSTGEVIGQWQQTAPGIGSDWTIRQVRSEVIANLDVGKLTAGSAAIDTAVVNQLWADLFVANKITSNEIEANSIGATHIAANAVEADKIDAGAITAAKISSDAIRANHIKADAITAKHTITGATVQTREQSNRGVELTDSGLYAYDANGNRTFYVNGDNGKVEGTGEFRTGVAGNRVVLGPDAHEGMHPGVRLFSGGSGARYASLFIVGAQSQLNWADYDTVLSGSEATQNVTGRTDLVLKHGGGFKLQQKFGTYSGVGIETTGQAMHLKGRIPSTHSSFTTFTHFRGPTQYLQQDKIWSWGVNYGQPAYSGTRVVTATGSSVGGSKTVIASTSETTASKFKVRIYAYEAGTFRFDSMSLWAEG